MELGDTIRNLSNHAGTGMSGYRNEFLKALVADFADARARSVLPLLNKFATAYANAELPPWFYVLCVHSGEGVGPNQKHPARQQRA